MAIAINGAGTITGITAGGLPDGIIVNADVKSDAVIATSKLSGALTAITSHGLGALASLATVGTSQTADNAITLAKMAGGTDGQIITYDASGDPVAVGPGTAGQVLTSAGAGAPPTFAAASGGEDGLTNNSNTTWMVVSANEEVTMPLQPSVNATSTTHLQNITGGGNVYQYPWNSERYDMNGDFASNTFIAPVTGRYLVCIGIPWDHLDSGNSHMHVKLITSNEGYYVDKMNPSNVGASGGFAWMSSASFIVDMDVSDAAYVSVQVNGPSNDIDSYGDVNNQYPHFHVALLS